MRTTASLILLACLGPSAALAHGTGVDVKHVRPPKLKKADAIDLKARRVPREGAPTVAILILSREQAGVPLSEAYGALHRILERRTALNVAPLDAIAIADRETAIRDCAGRAECFASKARAAATLIDLLLTVSVDRAGDGRLLALRLVDVHEVREVGASGDEVKVGVPLESAMERLAADVFPASLWDRVASIALTTDPSNAEVSIGGRACVSPCSFERLVPGEYTVTAKKAGHHAWEDRVTLPAGQRVRVLATLRSAESPVTAEPWFWGLLGAAAIGAGVAAFFAFRPDSKVVDLCIADDPGSCP